MLSILNPKHHIDSALARLRLVAVVYSAYAPVATGHVGYNVTRLD